MRIAFLHHSFRLGNGIDSLIYQLAKRMEGAHDVTVFTYVSDYKNENFKVEEVHIPFSRNKVSNAVLAPIYVNTWLKTRRMLESYDVVIAQLYPMSLLPLFPSRIKVPKIVAIEWSVPTNIPAQLYWKAYIQLLIKMNGYACRMSDMVICPSDFVGKWVERNHNCRYTKLLIDGIDFDILNKDKALLIDIGHPNILYVGRIHIHKNIETLIRAFSLVKTAVPNATLTLIGDTPVRSYYNALQALVLDYGLQDSITFKGVVPWGEIQGYYKTCDIYCSPSLWEGFMRCEAFAFEKPMVVFDATSNRETVHDGIDGYTVKGRTPKALAETLLKVLSDSDKATRMGKSGYAWAKKNLDFDRIAGNFVRIIS